MTVQKCWMYGVNTKSKEETTLSGEALKEHSRIVHECTEFMTVWKDVFEGAFNRAFTEFPDDVYSVTPRPVSISEVTSDSSRGITLVYRPETKKLNGWCAATLFDCLYMLSHLAKWVYGEDFFPYRNSGLIRGIAETFYNIPENRDAFKLFLDRVDADKTRRREVADIIAGFSKWATTEWESRPTSRAETLAEEFLSQNELSLRAHRFVNDEERKDFLRAIGASATLLPPTDYTERAVAIACARVQRVAKIYRMFYCA